MAAARQLGGVFAILVLLWLAVTLWGLIGVADGLAAAAKALGVEGRGLVLGWATLAGLAAMGAISMVRPALGARLVGLVLAVALGWLVYETWDKFPRIANVARWSGLDDLAWLRPWLTEFRMPLLCVAGFLGLTGLSWLWSKLGLGH